MEAKYKIKSSVGNGYEFEGKYFTVKQAQRLADKQAKARNALDFAGKRTYWQRLADKQAKARNALDFAGKRTYWQGVVSIVTPDVSLKDETYFRVNLAGK